MIIAVDFDGTLEINGLPNMPLINRLRAEQQQGNTVILWTCRCGAKLNEAVSFMLRYGLRPNFINANTPEMIRKYENDSRKIYADVYIDDKAVRA